VIPPARPASTPPPAPRFAALHTRDYRRYFALSLTAMTADNIEHVISYWVIYQAFHSPMLAGFAVISHWMPFLLFSVYSGALADRYDCRKLIQAGQILFMVASLSWGLLFLTGTLRIRGRAPVLHGAAGVTVVPATSSSSTTWLARAAQSAIRLNATVRYLAILGRRWAAPCCCWARRGTSQRPDLRAVLVFPWTIPYWPFERAPTLARPAARLRDMLRVSERRGATGGS
jgi:hypothetical protein